MIDLNRLRNPEILDFELFSVIQAMVKTVKFSRRNHLISIFSDVGLNTMALALYFVYDVSSISAGKFCILAEYWNLLSLFILNCQ